MERYFTEEVPKYIPDFEERRQQVVMADAVMAAALNESKLIVEAGTGIGKTLAYLIPLAEYAIKHKKRVMISTYSKALQSQIHDKDLPLVRKIFPELKYDIAFGRSNYYCIKRGREFTNRAGLFAEASDLGEMMKFLKKGEGLREKATFHIPNEVWDNINVDKNLCPEEKCSDFKECYYWQMRHRLRHAHIIVVNHHLFLSDVMTGRKLLPPTNSVVFDEAHKLEDTMRSMFSAEFSSFGYYKFLHEAEDFLRTSGVKNIKGYFATAKKEFEHFLQEVYDDSSIGLGKKTSILIDRDANVKAYIDIESSLGDILHELNKISNNSDEGEKGNYAEFLYSILSEHAATMTQWLQRGSRESFYWIEERKNKNVSFYITPYNLDKLFEEYIVDYYDSIILTSATLSTGEGFSYITKQFGLVDAKAGILKSPFDYTKQSLLHIDDKMPSPQSADFKDALIERISDIIDITQGNTLVLFTSIDLMTKAHKELKKRHKHIPCLLQGKASPMALLEKFRKKPSVLFATATFWQGVDVKGDDLKCVVITRLPFEVPEHPMQKAIYAHTKEEGGNDFVEIALPRAIFMLKQGFGRLIRSKDDYGIVSILDNRIVTKPYGRQFIKALPETIITHDMNVVADFFASISKR